MRQTIQNSEQTTLSIEQSSTDRVYGEVRNMAAAFSFKPDERINEVRLARELGTSRTPLREALYRLSAEGFLSFRPGLGFFCRSLNPTDILELYEARQAVESEAIRLAVERANSSQIEDIRSYLLEIEPRYRGTSTAATLVELDEEFHMRIVRLSANRELEHMLLNLNGRSRFIRLIDMDKRRGVTPNDHMHILQALSDRDPESASKRMREHIQRRQEEAAEAARAAFSRLYVPTDG